MTIDVNNNAPALEYGVSALAGLLRRDLDTCNKLIVARMDSPIALIPQLAGQIVGAGGGTRLRPLLTLGCARMCGYADPERPLRPVHLAACVDFIHAATLLHDDVADLALDEDAEAAGLGNKAAVLIGDFLFSRAFKLMVEDGSLEVLAILAHAAATIAEGEVLQLAIQAESVSESQYLAMIEARSAVLYAAACQVGGVIAGRPSEEIAALGVFGTKLGMAAQLVEEADGPITGAGLAQKLGDAAIRALAGEFAQGATAALAGFAASPYRDALLDAAVFHNRLRS